MNRECDLATVTEHKLMDLIKIQLFQMIRCIKQKPDLTLTCVKSAC